MIYLTSFVTALAGIYHIIWDEDDGAWVPIWDKSRVSTWRHWGAICLIVASVGLTAWGQKQSEMAEEAHRKSIMKRVEILQDSLKASRDTLQILISYVRESRHLDVEERGQILNTLEDIKEEKRTIEITKPVREIYFSNPQNYDLEDMKIKVGERFYELMKDQVGNYLVARFEYEKDTVEVELWHKDRRCFLIDIIFNEKTPDQEFSCS